jgi:hypothetical protein
VNLPAQTLKILHFPDNPKVLPLLELRKNAGKRRSLVKKILAFFTILA